MDQNRKSLPDSELKVMKIIWENNKAISTGEILNLLDDETSWKLSTLQMILSRLTEKGFVKNEKIGRFNYYSSLVDYAEYSKFETQSFIKKIYNNSSKNLIAALIEGDNLSKEDMEEIRRMLDKGGNES